MDLERQLDGEVAEFRAHVFASSTRAAYRTHRKSYLQFCFTMGYEPVPASPTLICRYAAFLARRLSSNSIPKYLNVIRLISLEEGYSNPLQGNWRLTSLLSGIKRVKGTSVARKLPITPHILLRIHQLLDLKSPVQLAFWSSSLLLFFGMLRKGNVLVPSRQGFVPSKHLLRSDFYLHQWGLEVRIRWTKTIQFRQRVLSIPLPSLPSGHPLCPAAALVKYFSFTQGAEAHGPAFVIREGGTFLPLTYPMFIKQLRHYLSQLGLDSHQFAGHSFRRGGASWALHMGLPGDVIQILGDWRSDAYKQYLVVPLSSKVSYIKHFSNGLPTKS